MTALETLKKFDEFCHGLWSIERPLTKVSSGEMKRWFKNKAVIINGSPVDAFDEIEYLDSLVLFPSGKRKTTLW